MKAVMFCVAVVLLASFHAAQAATCEVISLGFATTNTTAPVSGWKIFSLHPVGQAARSAPANWQTRAFSDASWDSASTPLGSNLGVCAASAPYRGNGTGYRGKIPAAGGEWPGDFTLTTEFFARKHFTLAAGTFSGTPNISLQVVVDNDLRALFFNDVNVLSSCTGLLTRGGCAGVLSFINCNIPASALVTGDNVVAFHLRDRGSDNGAGAINNNMALFNAKLTVSGLSTCPSRDLPTPRPPTTCGTDCGSKVIASTCKTATVSSATQCVSIESSTTATTC